MSDGTIRYVPPRDPQWHEQRGYWGITAGPEVMVRLKRLFPRVSRHRTGEIGMVATDEMAREIVWVRERWNFDISPADARRLKDDANRYAEAARVRMEVLAGEHRSLDGMLEPARAPRDYQATAATLAITSGRLLLADELGLGKTMSALMVLANPAAHPALIVCPTNLPGQWVDELLATFPWLRYHVIRRLDPYDISARRDMKGHDPDVLITGYGKLRGWGDHLAGKVRTVIFDEVQELRRADSERYEAAAQVAHHADFRVGLSATPVYNYGGEIHNIFQILAPDALGSRQEFAREWCGGAYWSDKVRVNDPAALGSALRSQGLMLRRTRKDVGRELPDVVRVTHAVDSSRDVYDRLTGEAIDLARLIVDQAGTKEDVWQARGELDWKLRHATGVAKAAYVADFARMLMDNGEPVVLFGWHRDVYDIWVGRLEDLDPILYTGSESPNQKQAAKDRFLAGDSDLLVMSLRSGAGLDGLQERAHVAVFGELDWSPGMHNQCIGRLHRDGQDDPVVAYFLLSNQGADPLMAEALELKRQQSDPIHDPDAPLFTEAPSTADRVQELAEQVLAKRRGTAVAA